MCRDFQIRDVHYKNAQSMNLIIVHNEKKALSPKTKDRMGETQEGRDSCSTIYFL